MEYQHLTPQEALHALANGKILENDEGICLLLEDALIVQQYTMGKNNSLVTQNYNGSFTGWFLPPQMGG